MNERMKYKKYPTPVGFPRMPIFDIVQDSIFDSILYHGISSVNIFILCVGGTFRNCLN